MSTKNVIENLAAHLAIRDLIDRYTNAINQRTWAEIEGLFVADAIWDVRGTEPGGPEVQVQGAPNIAKTIEAILGTQALWVQSNHASVIVVDGASATATTTMNEYTQGQGDAARTTDWGTYFDTMVQESDGEWRFKKRLYRFTWMDTEGSPGQVMTKFPLAQRPE